MIIDSLEKHAVISKPIMKNEVPRKFLKCILLSTQHLQNVNTKKELSSRAKNLDTFDPVFALCDT